MDSKIYLPDFSDKEDEPITDIESLIAKQLEKRNLDIPSIPACMQLHKIDVIVRIRTLKDKKN